MTWGRSLLVLGNGVPVFHNGCGWGDQRNKVSELSPELGDVVVNLEKNVGFGLLEESRPKMLSVTMTEQG